MNNQELLQELQVRLATGEISRGELASVLGAGQASLPATSTAVDHKSIAITKILYLIGATAVLIGVLFFMSQIWNDIGAGGRILVTLVLGLVFAGMGSVLFNTKPESQLGAVFHAIGGLLIPGGIVVALNELNVVSTSLWPVAIIFGGVFALYSLLSMFQKNIVLTFFAIANGTAFIYLLTESILAGAFYSHQEILTYLTMAIGASYLLLAYQFRSDYNYKLVGVLNFFGSAGILGAGFSRVFDSGFWEFFFFVLVVGGIILAIQLKSRAVLVVSTLFLVAHLIYITNQYFADSMGWTVSLIILGFMFIGLGYMSISISNKYIRE